MNVKGFRALILVTSFVLPSIGCAHHYLHFDSVSDTWFPSYGDDTFSSLDRAGLIASAATKQLGTMKSIHKVKAIVHITTIVSRLGGDFVEAGVAEGGGALPILFYLACTDSLHRRKFHLFDSFEGLPAPKSELDDGFEQGQWTKTLPEFWANAERWGELYRSTVNATVTPVTWEKAMSHLHVHVGLFVDTMPLALKESFVVALFCDGDMYQSSYDCLSGAGSRLHPHAYIYHDDYYTFSGNHLAVQNWKRENQDLGEVYLVPEIGKFTYYNEFYSSCSAPEDNRLRKAGTCGDIAVEAAFWQHQSHRTKLTRVEPRIKRVVSHYRAK